MNNAGRVYLVGAGPGDAGLLTLRGAELLGRADVVVYDALVSRSVVRLAREGAELVYGGKRSKVPGMEQGALNSLLVEKAREGKVVVRLKGGDPYTFGRGGEEAEELAEAGVPFEVVPGVSSATAAPNCAGIPLTHRDHCSSFTVITGHEDPDVSDEDLSWSKLATTPGTKVVMMGLRNFRRITERLMSEGMAGSTPVALIRWGSTPRQETLEGTLGTIADRVEEVGFGAPAVTVIGDVVKLRGRLNWFESRPLFGQRVVVTRERGQAREFAAGLEERGAEVLEVPAVRFAMPSQRESMVEALAGLNSYDWLVFTSANGVKWFFDSFFRAFKDLRDLGGVRIAAVGPATAASLEALHLQVDVMPERHDAASLAKALNEYETVENLRVLLARAEVATPELPNILEGMGGIVDDVAFYRTEAEVDVEGDEVALRLREEGADWLTFTSGSTVRHFHARFDLLAMRERFSGMRVASIGPETTAVLEELGVKVDVQAKVQTTEGLMEVMVKGRGASGGAAKKAKRKAASGKAEGQSTKRKVAKAKR
jgi:uroporphyrinogen III methyltransferase/synthase